MSRSYTIGTVDITKHVVDWNSLDGSTAARLEECIHQNGTGYFNPAYTVIPQPGTLKRDFFRQAQRALILWTQTLNRVLGGTARRKRACKNASYVQRRLEFIGILVINGVITQPHDWSITPLCQRDIKCRVSLQETNS